MKRVIAIVVTLAVILTSIAVPVLAVDEITDPGPSVDDILDRYAYFRYEGNDFYYESPYRSFSVYRDDLIDRFYFTPLVSDSNDGYLFGDGDLFYAGILNFYFFCSADIEFIDIYYLDEYSNQDAFELDFISKTEFSTSDVLGYLYHFSADFGMMIYENFYLDVAITDGANLLSFEIFSIFNDAYSRSIIPSLEVEAYGTVVSRTDQALYQHSFYRDLFYEYGNNINITGDAPIMPYDDRMSFYVSLGEGYQSADKFTLTLLSTGIFDNYYDYGSAFEAGLNFNSYSGENYNIPINTYFTKSHSFSWNGLETFLVTFTADLSPYNLDDGELELNFVVRGRNPNYANPNYYDYFVKITNCYYYFGFDDGDTAVEQFFNRLTFWWKFNFTHYLDGFFDYFWESLSELFDLIDGKFTELSDLIDGKFTDLDAQIEDKFESLFDKLEDYFGVPDEPAPPDTSDQEQEMQDQIDSMDGISDDFSDAGDEIDELLPSTPNYDDTGLPEFADIASARILELRAVFVVIWENDFIIQLLTFSCLLALGGFILFGER